MTTAEAAPARKKLETNYRAKRQFGKYPYGTVFPRWRLALTGDVDEMVARGMVEPTTDPVVIKFEVPAVEKPAESIPDADTQAKLNEATTDLEALTERNTALEAKVAELEASQMARLVEWGRATDQHAFERAQDAAKVRAAREAEEAVTAELRTAYQRIEDLEKKVAKKDKAKADPKTEPTVAPPG